MRSYASLAITVGFLTHSKEDVTHLRTDDTRVSDAHLNGVRDTVCEVTGADILTCTLDVCQAKREGAEEYCARKREWLMYVG